MPRAKKSNPEVISVPDEEIVHRSRPLLDPDARERMLVGLAVDLAEKQLRDGTAAPSTLNHYLKLATKREHLERAVLEKQQKLLQAKVEALDSSHDAKEMYEAAISAMKSYAPSQEE